MTELWVERTGIRRYTGRSSRGAEVLIGSETDEGVFTPGELLKIALAGCSGLSSDQPLRRRLGRCIARIKCSLRPVTHHDDPNHTLSCKLANDIFKGRSDSRLISTGGFWQLRNPLFQCHCV